MRDTHTHTEAETQRQKQALSREPDVGLDPRTPGSRPEPKADAQLLSHPGMPRKPFLILGWVKGWPAEVLSTRYHHPADCGFPKGRRDETVLSTAIAR